MCKKNEVQIVMTGHSISVCDIRGNFLKTWVVNTKFKREWILAYLFDNKFELNDVSYKVFPWLEELR